MSIIKRYGLDEDYTAGLKVLREIDQETATWMLECLPPARQSGRGFVNSEPYTHNANGKGVYFCCVYFGSEAYATLATITDWDSGALHSYERIPASVDKVGA